MRAMPSSGYAHIFRTQTDVKRVLVFAGQLGYQTRSFDAAARKMAVELVFVTDRGHQLADPWGAGALAVAAAAPATGADRCMEGRPRSGEHSAGRLDDA